MLLVAVVTSSPAWASSPEPIPFQPADVFALPVVSDVQISPDASQVAYVRQTPSIMTDRFETEIWVVDSTGATQRRLAGSSAQHPRWSPDGGSIAYVANDGAGHSRVFLAAAAGRTAARALTDGTVAPADLAWSHDGSAIAFTGHVAAPPVAPFVPIPAKPPGASWAPAPRFITAPIYQEDGAGFIERGNTALFVVSTQTGETKRIETAGLDIRGVPSWAPDGASLLFAACVSGGPADVERDRLYRETLATGQIARLTSGSGSDGGASPSPDGKTIAYLHTSLEGLWHPALWSMGSDGSMPHPLLPSLDRDVLQAGWTPGGHLDLSYNNHGAAAIARLMPGAHAVEVTAQSDDGSFSLAQDGTVGFALGTPDRPVAAAIAGGGGSRVLTHLADALLGRRTLGAVAAFDVKSSYDGETVPGFIIKPPHYQEGRRYPVILYIHGGPYGAEGPDWHSDLQLLAAAGYVVLYANPRGAQSYGFAYEAKLPLGVPDHDYDDLMSVVDAAVAQGIADPQRLYVAGQSYGGTMTAWITGRTHRFRAAAALKPSVDLAVTRLENDQYENSLIDPRGLPWEHPDLWWRTSPLSLGGAMSTPTVVIVGEDDRRTPIEQAEALYDTLRLRRVPAELVVYPETSHETLAQRPSQLISIAATMLDWFGRYH